MPTATVRSEPPFPGQFPGLDLRLDREVLVQEAGKGSVSEEALAQRRVGPEAADSMTELVVADMRVVLDMRHEGLQAVGLRTR